MKRERFVRLVRSFVALVVAALTTSVMPPAAAVPTPGTDAGYILWDGITDRDVETLQALPGVQIRHRLELIGGVSVVAGAREVPRLVAFTRARALRMQPDLPVRATLSRAAQTVHVKESSADPAGFPGAWSLGYTGAGVTVATLDTGIDAAHAGLDDLDDDPATADPKVVAFRDWASAGGAPVAPYDDAQTGHGTHTAGVLAGTGAGSSGDGPRGHDHVGIAYRASLVGLKVMNAFGGGLTADVIAAVDWAVANAQQIEPPIRVLNISLSSSGALGFNDGTSALSTAVDRAVEAGLVVVAAVGNGDSQGGTNVQEGNVTIPGDAQGAITVCASAPTTTPPQADSFADWDSEGPTADLRRKPDVCAPGDQVVSASSGTSGGYFQAGGTSVSAPFVAGIVALLLEAVPDLSPDQVKQVLVETASHAGSHNADRGYGQAFAREAIELALSRFGSGPRPLDVRLEDADSAPAGHERLIASAARGGRPPYRFDWDTDGDGAFDDASGPSVLLSPAPADGLLPIALRVTDAVGTSAFGAVDLDVRRPLALWSDDVEAGPGSWTTASHGSPAAAGWHVENGHARSGDSAWYAGNPAGRYGEAERVRMSRTFDFTSRPFAQSGSLLLSFALGGSVDRDEDRFRVRVRPTAADDSVEIWQHQPSDPASWTTHVLDITRYRGAAVDVEFEFTSGPPNSGGDPVATGPYVDDIEIIGTDDVSPGRIEDLSVTGTSATSVALSWTAPGEDDHAGTATGYELRRSDDPITTAGQFLAAEPVEAPVPSNPGTVQTAAVRGLDPGTTHHFAIRALDDGGNGGALSNLVAATTAGSADAPVISHPIDGALIATAGLTVTGETEPGAHVRVSEDDALIGEAAADGDGGFAVPITLGDGHHSLLVTSTVPGGSPSGASVVGFTVDTTPPVVEVTSGPPAETSERTATITFGANETAVFECSLDGLPPEPCLSPLELPRLAEGPHLLVIEAADEAGHTGSASVAWTVDRSTWVSIGTITDPVDDTNKMLVRVEGTGEQGAAVALRAASGDVRTPVTTVTAGDGGRWAARSLDWSMLPAGPVRIEAIITDPAGNAARDIASSTRVGEPSTPEIRIFDTDGHVGSAAAGSLHIRVGQTVAAGPVDLSLRDAAGATLHAGSVDLRRGRRHTFVVDLAAAGFADGRITAHASSGGAQSTDTSVLDRETPSTSIDDPRALYFSSGPYRDTVFAGTAADGLAGVAAVDVTLTNGSSTFRRRATLQREPGGSVTWRADFRTGTAPGIGSWTIHAVATDAAGNIDPDGATSGTFLL